MLFKPAKFFWVISVIAIILNFGCIRSQAEGNYNTVGLPRHHHSTFLWSYAGVHEWEGVCQSGLRQSPISFVNLIGENGDSNNSSIITSSNLSSMVFSSKCHLSARDAQVIMQNTNYTINMHFAQKKKGKITEWDTCMTKDPVTHIPYRFLELDFHIGPEHLIPHVNADAEMHLKFLRMTEEKDNEESSASKYLYISLPLQVVNDSSRRLPSDPSVLLDLLFTDGMLPLPDTMTSSPLPINISLFDFLPKSDDGYVTYLGSLTHPPCSENVRWVVFTTPMPFSPLSFKQLKYTISIETSSNARSPQPAYNRTVLRYRGGKVDWKEDKGFTRKKATKEAQLHRKGEKTWGKGLQNFLKSIRDIIISIFPKGTSISHALLYGIPIIIVLAMGITGYRRWKKPAVVGVDPRALRPLISSEERFSMYGSV